MVQGFKGSRFKVQGSEVGRGSCLRLLSFGKASKVEEVGGFTNYGSQITNHESWFTNYDLRITIHESQFLSASLLAYNQDKNRSFQT